MKNQHQRDVVIAGAGPTGLMLAGELALAGIDVAIVERRPSRELAGIRAGGLHARTIELLDQRGIADRFLAHGRKVQVASFVVTLDLADCPTRHPYGLALAQNQIESLLADWVDERSVPIHRDRDVVDFAQRQDGVDVTLSSGESLHARYLVGCDGGRSVVRKKAGVAFPGWEPSMSSLIAEVEMDEIPPSGIRRDDKGVYAIGPIEGTPRVRVVLRDEEVTQREPTFDELRNALVTLYGTDFGLRRATWLSRFTDATRQAASYRAGRVLLAGDAAHIHSPVGGQGLNLGVHDAVNLGWKLAQVVNGTSPESLLDSYHAERHPVTARVLRQTMAATALNRVDARIEAVRESVSELLAMDEPRRRYAAMMSGLDVHYDLGTGHPLLGRRMPDLEIETAHGPARVFSWLHRGRGVLVALRPGIAAIEAGAWAGRIERVEAQYEGPWELPSLGTVAAPSAVLVRPDGYVAWVGDGTDRGLLEAMTTWFGPPRAG